MDKYVHWPLNTKSVFFVWNLPAAFRIYQHLAGANFDPCVCAFICEWGRNSSVFVGMVKLGAGWLFVVPLSGQTGWLCSPAPLPNLNGRKQPVPSPEEKTILAGVWCAHILYIWILSQPSTCTHIHVICRMAGEGVFACLCVPVCNHSFSNPETLLHVGRYCDLPTCVVGLSYLSLFAAVVVVRF